MLLKISHGRYLEEILKFVCGSNVPEIEFLDGKIPGTQLKNPGNSIKTIYPTQATLLLTEILFAVLFTKIHSLVLSAKYYSGDFTAIS